jgi:hypothetical protein
VPFWTARVVRPLKVAAGVALVASIAAIVVLSRVTVRNDAAVTLTRVTVSGRGLEKTVAALKSGGTHTFWFVPRAETGAHLAFHAEGRDVDAGSHGYFPGLPHPGRALTLVVDPQLNVGRR